MEESVADAAPEVQTQLFQVVRLASSVLLPQAADVPEVAAGGGLRRVRLAYLMHQNLLNPAKSRSAACSAAAVSLP